MKGWIYKITYQDAKGGKNRFLKLRNLHWNRLESNALLVDNISKTAFTVQKTKAEKIQNELLELYKSRTSISA